MPLLFGYTASIQRNIALFSTQEGVISSMKQKDISALTLELVGQFFSGQPQPLIDHLDENVLWIGPIDSQALRGKDDFSAVLLRSRDKISYTLGDISTQITPVGKKGMNMVLFYEVYLHLEDGSSVITRQRTLLSWAEQKLQEGGEEESVPRIAMIMVSNAAPTISGQLLPSSGRVERANVVSSGMNHIMIRGMKDESHYLDANGIIYIESTDSSHHSLVHTVAGTIHCQDKVTVMAEKYGHYFLRSHASYLINPRYIRSLKRFSLTLSNGIVLPVPEKKYTAFKKLLNKWTEENKNS